MASYAEEVRAQLDRLLAERDRPGAVRAALMAVRDGHIDIPHLYTDVLSPLMVQTGTRWQSGDVRVWEEHYTSATVRTIVEALYPLALDAAGQTAAIGRSVLLACPPREQHDLGLRMLADRFLLAGWTVHYLGTDTPVDEIAAAADALGVELIVLSASTHFNRVLLRGVVDQLKASAGDARVTVGGPAFSLDREWPPEELFDPAAFDLPPQGTVG